MTDKPKNRSVPLNNKPLPQPLHVGPLFAGTVLRTADGSIIGQVGNPICAICGEQLPSDELIYRVGPGSFSYLCQDCAHGDEWKQLALDIGKYGE